MTVVAPGRLTPLARGVRILLWSPLLVTSVAALAEEGAVTTLPTVQVKAQQANSSSEATRAYTVSETRTATKLPLAPRETPQAVTVVTREKMDDFQQNTINNVLDSTVGVNVERIETDRTYYPARGFDITNFQVDGLGMPMANGNVNGDLDTAIFDRVEVLRGANGLMSGTGNPSATVNMVRKRPTKETQMSVKGNLGSWQEGRGEADISGALTDSGNWRGRTVVVHQEKNSYLDRYSNNKTVLYGVTEGDLNDQTLLTLGYSYEQSDSDSPLWGALPLYYSDGTQTHYDRSTSTSTDWAYWNVRNHRAFIELNRQLAGGWQSKVAYQFIRTTQDARMFYVYGTPDKSDGSGLYSYPSQYQQTYNQHVVDWNVEGPFRLWGREHKLVAGIMASRDHMEERSLYSADLGTALPALEDWTGDYAEPEFNLNPAGSTWRDREEAAYVASQLHLTRDLAWVVGTRYASWTSTGENYGVQRNASATGRLVPYSGLVYDLNDSLSAYVSYASIFAPQSGVDENGDRLDPLTGHSYETGLKGEHFGGQLTTTLALFTSKQDNVKIAGGTRPDGQTYYSLEDGVRSRGYELEASGNLTDNWQLAGGYTRLIIQDADGQETNTYTPKQQIKASSTYRVLPKWKVGANLRWQDSIYRVNGAGTQTRQKSYALLDLMSQYDFNKHLYAALNVYNVGDVKYLNSLYWDQGFYGAPRSFMLSAGWKY